MKLSCLFSVRSSGIVFNLSRTTTRSQDVAKSTWIKHVWCNQQLWKLDTKGLHPGNLPFPLRTGLNHDAKEVG